MRKSRLNIVSRSLALFLSITLGLSSPAFALRQTGMEESKPENKEKLVAALTGVEENPVSRRQFLASSAVAAGAVAIDSTGLTDLLGQESRTPSEVLADLATRFGPKRLGVVPVSWGDPSGILQLPDYFSNLVGAHLTTNFISGAFADLPRDQQQAILDQAKKAKLSTLGLMVGNPDWVLASKREDMRRRIGQILDAISKLDTGDLHFAIVLDVEPHTREWRERTGWNGDLAGYSAMLKEAVAVVGKKMSVVTFEPHWWVNGHTTEDGLVIKNLNHPAGIVVAGMTYQPDARRILSVSERVWTRARAGGNRSLFGLETKPGIPNTFFGQEGTIPATLLEIHQGLPRDVEPSVEGLFIHFGSAGPTAGIRRTYDVIKPWVGKPKATSPSPAQPAGKFGVKGGETVLKEKTVKLTLQVPEEWRGKEGELVAFVMRKTDTYYKVTPYEPILDSGVVNLVSDRDLEEVSARVVVVIRKSDGEAFKTLYDEGRARGSYKATEKYAVAIVAVEKDGTARVVEKLPASGLEEAQLSRRGFLMATAVALPGLHLNGLFLNGDSTQLANDDAGQVANLDRGRKETFIYKLELKLGETTPASLPPITRLLVQRGAEIPSVWKDVPVSWLDENASKAQQEISELQAQPGEMVLIRPVDDETARGWDRYLLSKQLLGIQATAEVAGLIDALNREGQLAILLGSLGENGGLILWASINERTSDERYLVVHA